MKNKILVDFSMVQYRFLYSARTMIKNNKNRNREIIYEGKVVPEYIPLFFDMVVNHIMFLKQEFNTSNENITLFTDGKSYRKELFNDYKGNRPNKDKDDFDWEEFFGYLDILKEQLQTNTKLQFFLCQPAEADDSIYVLSKHLSELGHKVIVSTSDKDIRQVLKFDNVKFYDPMKKRFFKDFSEHDLLLHTLIGDTADNIPNIKYNTTFSDKYIMHLKGHDIHLEDVESVLDLEVHGTILNKFLENSTTKDVYKKVRFGPVTAGKIISNGELDKLLENTLIKKNFELNKLLIDMSTIPESIVIDIIDTYNRYYDSSLLDSGDNDGILGILNMLDAKEKCSSRSTDLSECVYHRKNNMFNLQDFMSEFKMKTCIQKIGVILT